MLLITLRFLRFQRRLFVVFLALPILAGALSVAAVILETQIRSAGTITAADGFPQGWYRLSPDPGLDLATLEPFVRVGYSTSTETFGQSGNALSAEVDVYWSTGAVVGMFDPRTTVRGRHPSRPGEAEVSITLASLLGLQVGDGLNILEQAFTVVGIFAVPSSADAIASRIVMDGPPPDDAALMLGPEAYNTLGSFELRGSVLERSNVGRQGVPEAESLLPSLGPGALSLLTAILTVLAVFVVIWLLAIRLSDDVVALSATGWSPDRGRTAGALAGLLVGFLLVIASLALGCLLAAAGWRLTQSVANQYWLNASIPWGRIVMLFAPMLFAFCFGVASLWDLAHLRSANSSSGFRARRVPFYIQMAAASALGFGVVAALRSGLAMPAAVMASCLALVLLVLRAPRLYASRKSLRLRLFAGMLTFQSTPMLALTTLLVSIVAIVGLGAGVLLRLERSVGYVNLPLQTYVASGTASEIDALEARLDTNRDIRQLSRVRWDVVGAPDGEVLRGADAISASCLASEGSEAFQRCATKGEIRSVVEVGVVEEAAFNRLREVLVPDSSARTEALVSQQLGSDPVVLQLNRTTGKVEDVRALDGAMVARGLGGQVPGLLLRSSSDVVQDSSGAGYAGVVIFGLGGAEALSRVQGAVNQSPGVLGEFEPGRLPDFVQTARVAATLLAPLALVLLYYVSAILARRSHQTVISQLEVLGLSTRESRRYLFVFHLLPSGMIAAASSASAAAIVWWASGDLGATIAEGFGPSLGLALAAVIASVAASGGSTEAAPLRRLTFEAH